MRAIRYAGAVLLALLALSFIPTSLPVLLSSGGLLLAGMAAVLLVIAVRLWLSARRS